MPSQQQFLPGVSAKRLSWNMAEARMVMSRTSTPSCNRDGRREHEYPGMSLQGPSMNAIAQSHPKRPRKGSKVEYTHGKVHSASSLHPVPRGQQFHATRKLHQVGKANKFASSPAQHQPVFRDDQECLHVRVCVCVLFCFFHNVCINYFVQYWKLSFASAHGSFHFGCS